MPGLGCRQLAVPGTGRRIPLSPIEKKHIFASKSIGGQFFLLVSKKFSL